MLAGVVFMSVAYISKFRPISKSEVLTLADNDIWNDKDSDDYLRYLRFECYITCNVLSYLFTDVFTGFTNVYRLDRLGPREFSSTGVIYLVFILCRIFYLNDMRKSMAQ